MARPRKAAPRARQAVEREGEVVTKVRESVIRAGTAFGRDRASSWQFLEPVGRLRQYWDGCWSQQDGYRVLSKVRLAAVICGEWNICLLVLASQMWIQTGRTLAEVEVEEEAA